MCPEAVFGDWYFFNFIVCPFRVTLNTVNQVRALSRCQIPSEDFSGERVISSVLGQLLRTRRSRALSLHLARASFHSARN